MLDSAEKRGSEMRSFSGNELTHWDARGSSADEENIFVCVRMRPLNDRETSRNDFSAWECVNNNTIIFKSNVAERSIFPSAYTFDRVFGCDCTTTQVYEEGPKEVALSVVRGINSTIFAYGQTSSGKTYTMSHITEYTIADIFDYIHRQNDREFALKFSAMEIYNEAVRDLLSEESTPLRLLDDPERGTVVEKLTEETLRDWSHLKELLSVCEAQRQIGETSLNQTSSRSHQILRLTIESSPHKFLRAENSSTLTASVNFVDLAGSERASQALSAGARLKEGCHINRSLLTLGTVIRKLSEGRNGHVPYRNSKLTRILQNSLGGNARTAIICTMSPAHCHVEQSRNTLLFASCAKQVSTNAKVNVVMSDKELVKQLQKELIRLENELRSLESMSSMPNSAALLKEKDLLIVKMDKEIKHLKKQQDLAQSRIQNLLLSTGVHQVSRSLTERDFETYMKNAWIDEYSPSESSEVVDPLCSDITSNIPHLSDRCDGLGSDEHNFQLLDHSEDSLLSDDSPGLVIDKVFGPDPSQGWEINVQKHKELSEDNCKEVQCVEEQSIDRNFKSDVILSPEIENWNSTPNHSEPTHAAYKQKIQDMQKTIDFLVNPHLAGHSSFPTSPSRSLVLSRNRSCKAILSRPTSPWAGCNGNTTPNGFEKDFQGKSSGYHLKYFPGMENLIARDSERGDVSSVHNSGMELNEVGKSESDQQFSNDLEQEVKPNTDDLGKFVEDTGLVSEKPDSGLDSEKQNIGLDSEKTDLGLDPENQNIVLDSEKTDLGLDPENQDTGLDYEKQDPGLDNENQDIGLDSEKKDPGLDSEKKYPGLDSEKKDPGLDSENQDIDVDYVQVSLQPPSHQPSEFERQQREIVELWDACNVPLVHRTNFFLLFKGDPSDSVYMEVELRRLSFLKSTISQGTKLVIDGQILTSILSKRALNHERQMLSKQILKRFSAKEREALYQKWRIGLKTKHRRLQLSHKLWTETKDMNHVKESAALVAKLVGLSESVQPPKEMFGLSFPPRVLNRKPSWRRRMSLSSLI